MERERRGGARIDQRQDLSERGQRRSLGLGRPVDRSECGNRAVQGHVVRVQECRFKQTNLSCQRDPPDGPVLTAIVSAIQGVYDGPGA